MRILSETAAKKLVTIEDAIDVVETVFAKTDAGEAQVFPVVIGRASDPSDMFGIKSGLILGSGEVGAKIGTFWPRNRTKGLESHGSTTFFLDDETGVMKAMVSATYLTALRTAAADGVAVKHLSRADSETVAIIGAGHQAWYDLLAVRAVRPIRRVLVWSRTGDHAEAFARRAREKFGLAAESVSIADAASGADIVVTATAAREALVKREWIRPGTHISAMGADTSGKQELAVDLVASASLFADVIAQAISIGEFEAAYKASAIKQDSIRTIGSVIRGTAKGRTTAEDITIFDSSGMALQDLAIGTLALRKAEGTPDLQIADLS